MITNLSRTTIRNILIGVPLSLIAILVVLSYSHTVTEQHKKTEAENSEITTAFQQKATYENLIILQETRKAAAYKKTMSRLANQVFFQDTPDSGKILTMQVTKKICQQLSGKTVEMPDTQDFAIKSFEINCNEAMQSLISGPIL